MVHQEQITQARQVGTTGLEGTEALQRQLTSLLVRTGALAVLAGEIAAVLANRAVRPILKAATVSTKTVNTSEQSLVVAESFTKLAASAQES